MAAEPKTQILARARELGFDAVGIARAEPSPHTDFLDEWLKRGFAGEMAYMARDAARRKDLRAVMSEARSIVVVALNYYTGDSLSGDASRSTLHASTGFVARYARGDDYHEVVTRKLEMLAAFICGLSREVKTKVYVDTGPLLERELAQLAGIGFVGKSTILINRGLGTWCFLGEILTSLELEPDAPGRNLCGMCARCIDVCPTRAIVEPFRLDSRRCISYLTIELKGAIPRELRPLVGIRIFGCDDCLEVCPWNRFARLAQEAAFQPRNSTGGTLQSPGLIELLSLDYDQFRRAFLHSPISRIKRRGLLRNVCVAIGNAGDRRAVPALVRALADREPLVRGHAAWALGRLGGEESRRALEEAAGTESDNYVSEELRAAFQRGATA